MDALKQAIEATDAAEEALELFRKKNNAGAALIPTVLQLGANRAAIAQAEATERVAMQLGNIHQALMTPNAEREPITVADLLKRIADALYGLYPQSETESGVADFLKDIALDVSEIATKPNR